MGRQAAAWHRYCAADQALLKAEDKRPRNAVIAVCVSDRIPSELAAEMTRRGWAMTEAEIMKRLRVGLDGLDGWYRRQGR
jgi:hypothetical protein